LTKGLIALICSLALLLAGCGGGGQKRASATAEGKAACAKVKTADANYSLAIGRYGLRLFEKPLNAKAIAATREFRASVEQLRRVSSDSEKKQLDELVSALARQEKVFEAFRRHDLATAQANASVLNAALYKSIANLAKICPGVPPTIFKPGSS
jgi:hypothetical protein